MNWHHNHLQQQQLLNQSLDHHPNGNLFVSSSTSTSTSTSTLTSMSTTTSTSSSSSFFTPSSLESLVPFSAHSLSFSQGVGSCFLEDPNDPLLVESDWNKLVAEYPTELVCLLSRGGIFLRASGSSQQITGLRADQLVGLNVAHLIHVNDLPAFYDHLNQAANEGKISTLSHLLRSKNLPHSCYVQVESTLSLYSPENVAVGESPCILMLAELSEPPERFTNCPVSEESVLTSTNESKTLEDLRHEAEQLRKLLDSRQVELEALRKERNDQQAGKKKKKRQAPDLTCEECGTTESPEWRKGPSGTQSLCNACGLRYSKRLKKRAYLNGRENPEQSHD